MKQIKKLIILILLSLFLLVGVYAENRDGLTNEIDESFIRSDHSEKLKEEDKKEQIKEYKEEDFLKLFDEKWNLKIGCYNYGRIENKVNNLEELKGQLFHCRGKNMIIPKKEIAKIFFEMYATSKMEDVDKLEKVCDDNCIHKIANRWAIINFESGFNGMAKSGTLDYGIIQVHKNPYFLGDDKIKESMERLDNRWNHQIEELCYGKYKIKKGDWENVFKCLAMRHNGRRSLNNSYSERANKARKYYIQWLTDMMKKV